MCTKSFFPGLSVHVCIKIGSTCKVGDFFMHQQQPRIMICLVWIWFNPAAHTRQIWDQVGCWWTAISDVSNMLCYHQLLLDLTHCVFILQITVNQMKQHTDLKKKKTILEQTNTNGNDQTKKTNRNNVDSVENDSDRLVLWAKEWFLPIHPWTELDWEGALG